MATLFDEQKLVSDNIFKFEERINSQISRFLDKTPVFTTFYHINVNESTTDEGFRDIEAIIGSKSPLRFQKIENFPIYGLDSVVLNIQDNEQGLDTEYQGECVILPNTIKPLPNDFFMINHVKGSFLFRVIEVQYDSIRPDNFYKISYRFEYLDDGKVDEIDNQVQEKYSCVLENIGTENTCIIKEEYKDQLDKIDALYNDMVNTYKVIFYNKRYNCFLGEDSNGYKIFDPLQTLFFNKHRLLNKKNSFDSMMLTEGFNDSKRPIKYEKSIYRFIERRDVKLIGEFPYNKVSGLYKKDSPFCRWNDQSILITDVPMNSLPGTFTMLPSELVSAIRLNAPAETKYVDLIQKFVRNESITIYDIPLDLNEELLKLDANIEVFFFTPILMYIIQTIVNDFLKLKK